MQMHCSMGRHEHDLAGQAEGTPSQGPCRPSDNASNISSGLHRKPVRLISANNLLFLKYNDTSFSTSKVLRPNYFQKSSTCSRWPASQFLFVQTCVCVSTILLFCFGKAALLSNSSRHTPESYSEHSKTCSTYALSFRKQILFYYSNPGDHENIRNGNSGFHGVIP